MSLDAKHEYTSIGGNRQTPASSYSTKLGSLAFGADSNIAIWKPLAEDSSGVSHLLKGHTGKVCAVEYNNGVDNTSLLSGDADGVLNIWTASDSDYQLKQSIKACEGSLVVITSLDGSRYFATGAADKNIKVWTLDGDGVHEVLTINSKSKFLPMALAAGSMPGCQPEDAFFLVAGGTRNDIHVFTIQPGLKKAELACTLTGHEGWIRSLSLKKSSDRYLLASTSADKYTRLWKFSMPGTQTKPTHTNGDVPVLQQTLTAKVKTVGIDKAQYSITFEALLLGHEDWVYSADWQDSQEERLLTTSADGTLALWEPDSSSGIWVSETRLGEISGQKGATTATGSSGGFWTGKWINSETVITLGRTGSWRMWKYDTQNMFWNLVSGIGGHVDSVNSLCWSTDGSYLLTTSSDQTTRLHAQWKRDGITTWHEFSRCQIHGYDCTVVECITPYQFVSGAEEKLLRVFNEPKELADTLHRLCDIELPQTTTLPETAAIPVLGLSNKEMGEPDDIIEAGPRKGDDDYAMANALAELSLSGITQPPSEDLLSRHTLWPEHEKLYGHGYEISEAAYGNGLLATACKASSLEHAAIRFYSSEQDWRQVDQPLVAHSLTVTRLAWNLDGLLLSVGRDRQWTVFGQNNGGKYEIFQSMPKAHTRMILDAAWSPNQNCQFFVTAGRDKSLKIWSGKQEQTGSGTADVKTRLQFSEHTTISRPSPISSIAIWMNTTQRHIVIAVGEDDGHLSLQVFLGTDFIHVNSINVNSPLYPAKQINRMSWRPQSTNTPYQELAIGSADGSLRILSFNLDSICTQPQSNNQ